MNHIIDYFMLTCILCKLLQFNLIVHNLKTRVKNEKSKFKLKITSIKKYYMNVKLG